MKQKILSLQEAPGSKSIKGIRMCDHSYVSGFLSNVFFLEPYLLCPFPQKSKLLLLVIKYNKVEYDDEQLFTFFSRPPVFDTSKSYVCLQ